jgi:hypothetical protein
MRKPWMKPYPDELKATLNKLLPRFYVRVSKYFGETRDEDIRYLKLVYFGYICEGMYLVLPDAYGVSNDLWEYLNEQITIFDLKDRVQYILRYNGINAVLEPYLSSLHGKIPKRVANLVEQMLFGFNFDYPSENVKETFRTHTSILQLLVMIVANFHFPGRLSSALLSYVNGKTTTEQLLSEVSSIYQTFKGLKPGLRFRKEAYRASHQNHHLQS